jgi:hypothetical protein
MRAFVAVKRVVDYAVKTRIAASGRGVELAGVKHAMNPFCEIAMEEAVRLKEKKLVADITAVTIGGKAAVETLRTALAMGADAAVHIETEMRVDQELQPLAVAKVLAWLTAARKPDLWILGKQVRGVAAPPAARRAHASRLFRAAPPPLPPRAVHRRRLQPDGADAGGAARVAAGHVCEQARVWRGREARDGEGDARG